MADKKVSVYASIANDIISKISAGEYKIGSLLPSERILMGKYSVQRTTIRRALDILTKDGYVKKVMGVGTVVTCAQKSDASSVENDEKAAIPFKKAKKISVLLPQNTHQSIDSLPRPMLDILVKLNEKGADFSTDNEENIDKNSSVICLGHSDSEKGSSYALARTDDHRCVIFDSDKAAYVALTYLEEQGHTKIAYIGTDNSFEFENAFYDSFSVVNSYFEENLVMLSGSDEKAGFEGFANLYRKNIAFTAICTPNDEVAAGVIRAAEQYRLSVPKDIAVISLCSTDKNASLDRILFDPSALADEIIDSAEKSERVAAILFGGNLKLAK